MAALRRMDYALSFESVAKEAGVSRSWLYTETELRGEIERLRGRRNSTTSRLIPDRQKISDASLVRRLEVASERIRELHNENRRLRDALAEALGANRAIIGGPRLLTLYHLDEKRGTKAMGAMGSTGQTSPACWSTTGGPPIAGTPH